LWIDELSEMSLKKKKKKLFLNIKVVEHISQSSIIQSKEIELCFNYKEQYLITMQCFFSHFVHIESLAKFKKKKGKLVEFTS
jgi:hypothetical protein